ncbi:hypothetical protein C2S52_004388 [Perilla frutescens var. hirtella]|nr:hypothetical protein C2S51_011193 [Perilla frutescens var. frutescens]KAH6793911.1 hypothetical protein C2S52_004388 [Perilla frutescens var. hirtella]
MKRGLKWSDGEDDGTSSSDESSSPDTNSDGASKSRDTSQSSKLKPSLQVDSAKKKKKGIDFEALSRHGYRGGLSVLSVPPPKELEKEQDWSWCSGKERKLTKAEEEEESFEERQKTRAALADGEQLLHVQSRKEKNISFQQKEKRKRDLGQASRGKNYVEEEKRLLRDSGVYSGFDS